MTVAVRSARATAVEDSRCVAQAAWRAAHALIAGPATATAVLAEHSTAHAIARYARDTAWLCLAGTQGGAVVGFTMAVSPDEPGTPRALSWRSVRPDRWGEGTGRRLLDAIEARMRTRGGTRIAMSVVTANERAAAIYEAVGDECQASFEDDRPAVRSHRVERALDRSPRR